MTIDVERISFAYQSLRADPVRVFDDLTLRVASAESVGIMGRERTGKSTLLQLIDGLLNVESGTVRVDTIRWGEQRSPATMLRRKIGFIFQYPEQQFFCETLEEELRYTMRLCGIPGDKQGECMTGALERAGLPPGTFRERSPFTLSFGESKRLAIAIASIMQPRLVLADEPTAGLDGSGTAFALRVLGDLHARGSTLLVASQDVDFLAELTTRIVILSDGRIAADGPSFDILGNEALLARFGYERPQIVVLMEEWKRQGVRLPAGVRRVSDLSRPGGQGVHTG